MIIKITMMIGLGTLLLSEKVNAQESCDSTCNTPIGLQGGYKTTKKSITQVVHNYNDYSVRYEYQTNSCPAGYQGRGGGAGSITERRAVVTFKTGRVDIGEWIALTDNCEIAPPPPPPPPPAPPPAPSVMTKTIFACNWGYGNNSVGCPFSVSAANSWPFKITARWTFMGYDSTGKPYGNLSYDSMIPMENQNHPVAYIRREPSSVTVTFPVNYLEDWQYREVRSLWQSGNYPDVMPLEIFETYVHGVTQWALDYY